MSLEKELCGSRFLITGGAGFIGSNIAEVLLDKGCYVRILDNFSTGKKENIEAFYKNEKFEFIEGDLRDLEICRKSCKDIDFVLHQGALGSVSRSVEDPISTNEVNVSGTLNMLIASKENFIKRFVFASSSSVYGDDVNIPQVEDRVGNPLSPYAVSKKVNELYAKNFFDLYGLKTIGLRYFNVFGKRQDPDSVYAAVIPIFVKNIISGHTSIIYGDGEQSRDFTYVGNVVQANIKACFAGEEAWGKVFNIACGKSININTLFKKLCELLDKKANLVYSLVRDGDVKHSKADITKTMKVLKYQPEVYFDHGLELTIDWYISSILGN